MKILGHFGAYRRVRKSNIYKYVSLFIKNGAIKIWAAHTDSTLFFETEKEAARAVDLYFILQNKDPINNTLKKVIKK